MDVGWSFCVVPLGSVVVIMHNNYCCFCYVMFHTMLTISLEQVSSVPNDSRKERKAAGKQATIKKKWKHGSSSHFLQGEWSVNTEMRRGNGHLHLYIIITYLLMWYKHIKYSGSVQHKEALERGRKYRKAPQ